MRYKSNLNTDERTKCFVIDLHRPIFEWMSVPRLFFDLPDQTQVSAQSVNLFVDHFCVMFNSKRIPCDDNPRFDRMWRTTSSVVVDCSSLLSLSWIG